MDLPETQRLLEIMAQLRHPETGCPWDIEQNFLTIAPYTIEEAYEVADAIQSGDRTALRDELGDLLLQVVFHSQMAREENSFTFEDVARSINEKMIRRHPHVFADAAIATADEQTQHWEKLKAEERQAKGESSLLANIPAALPALMRAEKIQKRASRVGFDWPDASGVVAKIHEELKEVEDVLAESTHEEAIHRENLAEEIGDLLFAVTNLARFFELDAESALRAANHKFTQRFSYVETHSPIPLAQSTLAQMEALWNEAKEQEKIAKETHA
jgi:ATP diphosphatase